VPDQIAAGPDGALWFTEQNGDRIGRITTAGRLTETAVPTPGSFASGIAAGPDGGMWFTEQGTDKIGRVTALTEAAARKACVAERRRIGTKRFGRRYGAGKRHARALPRCVSRKLAGR
jgi:streptogramin lyase